jgi:hypothetical protein
MKMSDIINESESLVETKMVWAKRGNKVARKYRCTFGKRKGRVVANPSQCSKPVDMKKRFTLRGRMARKAQRTKRTNPASKMVKALNR